MRVPLKLVSDHPLDTSGRAADLAQLVACIDAFTPHDGIHATPVPHLRLIRTSAKATVTHVLFEPAVCLMAQGRKHLIAGDQLVEYDPAHHVVASHHIPVAGEVQEASGSSPYLCAWIDIDPAALGSLLLDGVGVAAPQEPAVSPRGIYTARTGDALLNAVLRLCRLLETPRHIPALAPLIHREIMYWLLMEENGWRLAQFVTPGTQPHRISLAIDWLRQRYKEPLNMSDVARVANMSRSSLNSHFKAVTNMSPLQYQKRLRLLEARRLLMSEAISAAHAAHSVGYESPSQFNREYARMFGNSPARDVKQLRAG